MQSVTGIISVVLLLSACQGSNLKDSNGHLGSSTKTTGGSVDASGRGNDGYASPDIPYESDTINPPATNRDSIITENTGTLIIPRAASDPVAIAGASLVCSLTSSDSLLRCNTYINATKVDLKPSKFFYDTSTSSDTQPPARWTEIAMTTVELGGYTAPAPTNLPSSFVVIMRYTDAKTEVVEHLASKVGAEALTYPNIVKNGNFETEFLFKGNSHDFLAADNASAGWVIGTFPESVCSKDTTFRVQKSSDYPSLEGERWASLGSRCKAATGTPPSLPSIMQVIPVQPGNFYFVSFQARVDTEALKGEEDASIRVQWGAGGEARALTFAPKSTSWQTYSYNSTTAVTSVRLFFLGNNNVNHHAVMIDNIKVYDLGTAPPL